MQDDAIAARVRAIYAVERLSRLLDDSEHPALRGLPEETLGAVVTCVNAIADVVERHLMSDAEPNVGDVWDAPALTTR